MKGNKRIDLLLTLARKATENEDYSDDTGISNDELIQYINDAQYRLLSLITATHPTVFVKEGATIDVVASQESYALPDDALLENRVTSIEYSDTSLTRDYIKLAPMSLASREVGFEGFPSSYIRRSGNILLSPIPSSGGILRVNYQRRIAELDLRRGQVSAVTLDSSTNTITSLTIDNSQGDFDSDKITECDFISIVNVHGEQQMPKIQKDSIDSSTGVVTINSGFTYVTGESISVGDFVVCGYDASSHTELPKICERYLIAYLAWKLFKRDSSEDAYEQRNELKSMEKDIVDAFRDVADDLELIPMIAMDD